MRGIDAAIPLTPDIIVSDVFESRLYKKPVLQRRCIIPVSGFFEWKKEGSAKRPFTIFLKDSPIISLAGIWTSWRTGTPEEQRSFSIVTTSANDLMAKIHDRMSFAIRAQPKYSDDQK